MPSDLHPEQRRGWLDELSSAGRENLDAGHVARYDAKEDASAADELRLCRALGERAGLRIEDVSYSDDRIFAKYVLRRVA
jgi:hypothetical protein